MIEVLGLDTPSLGDRSYLATDGEVAVVVDPQRDVDRVLDLAAAHRVRIGCVAETHLHNDYVSGGLELARRTGARYLVCADDRVAFEREPVRDGDVVRVGRMRVRVLATPGHTLSHLAYVLDDDDGAPAGVFTGGSLLFGATGRPDLLGPEHTVALARAQHASAHRLAAALPDGTAVFPTHGFGSFCTVGAASSRASTIGRERAVNPVLGRDAEAWVAETLARLGPYPAYYARIGPANAAGPQPVDRSPLPVAGPAELRRRIGVGEWVVDVRTRRLFAAGHVPGAVNVGLDGAFPTYLGWLLPEGVPVTVLAGDADALATARRELTRIGIDRPAAAAVGRVQRWCPAPASFPRVDFAGLARADGPVVLDVRRDDERAAVRLAGAHGIPLHELPSRVGEVPAGRPVWVHCAGGYRAGIAASLLARAGRQVVLVDDEFARAEAAGLAVVRPSCRGPGAGPDSPAPARRRAEVRMSAPIDDGAPDDARSGADIAEAIDVAEAGSQVQAPHDRGQFDRSGEAPVEQVRDDPEMTEGQVVYGSGGEGATTSAGSEGVSSGAAQSVRGARPIDET